MSEAHDDLPITKSIVEEPRDWDTAVAAAYIRVIGGTQKQAAAAAGCGERTLRDWENSDFWERAKQEAADRWLNGVVAHSRKTIIQHLEGPDGDPNLALKLLERLDDKLLPPKVRAEHSGPNGGPIETKELGNVTEADIAAQLKKLNERMEVG